jgi:hypothetical protein
MSLIFAKNPRTGRFALPVAAQRGATQQFQITFIFKRLKWLFFVTGLETLQILGVEMCPQAARLSQKSFEAYLTHSRPVVTSTLSRSSISGPSTKRLTSTLNDIIYYSELLLKLVECNNNFRFLTHNSLIKAQ